MKAHVLVFGAALCAAAIGSSTLAAASDAKPTTKKQAAPQVFCDLHSCRVIKEEPAPEQARKQRAPPKVERSAEGPNG